jgi:archaellum component FlaC
MTQPNEPPYVRLRVIDWLKLIAITGGPAIFSINANARVDLAHEAVGRQEQQIEMLTKSADRMATAADTIARHDERIGNLQRMIFDLDSKVENLSVQIKKKE